MTLTERLPTAVYILPLVFFFAPHTTLLAAAAAAAAAAATAAAAAAAAAAVFYHHSERTRCLDPLSRTKQGAPREAASKFSLRTASSSQVQAAISHLSQPTTALGNPTVAN